MVSRFMSLLIVSLTLMGFSTGCVTSLQERNEYPDIQAGNRAVLLLKVTDSMNAARGGDLRHHGAWRIRDWWGGAIRSTHF